MTIEKPIDDLTAEDILLLINNKVPEGPNLDYKMDLRLDDNEQRDELRRDVSAFANSAGGHLVIGIEEVHGCAARLTNFQLGNSDAFLRRVDEIIQTRISPRLPGVRCRSVSVTANQTVAVVHIPRSFAKPHQVTTHKGDVQFWARNSSGKYRLDVSELRSIIIQSESLRDRVRRFRLDRLVTIAAGDTPVRLDGTARCVLHLLPLTTFEEWPGLNVERLATACEAHPPLVHWKPEPVETDIQFNLDGVLMTCPFPDGSSACYTQVFRDGTIEAVDGFYISRTHNTSSEQIRAWKKFHEETLLYALQEASSVYRVLGINAPIVVLTSLLNVSGYRIITETGNYSQRQQRVFGRRDLLLPDVRIDDLAVAPHQTLQPVFDAIWNEGGYPRCLHYVDGEYKHS